MVTLDGVTGLEPSVTETPAPVLPATLLPEPPSTTPTALLEIVLDASDACVPSIETPVPLSWTFNACRALLAAPLRTTPAPRNPVSSRLLRLTPPLSERPVGVAV